MTRAAITILPPKLKCDATGCDHVETVPEITADLIGKPCPKCGANLLTEEDFLQGIAMLAILEALNDVLPRVPDGVPTETQIVSINPHGDQLDITAKPYSGKTGDGSR